MEELEIKAPPVGPGWGWKDWLIVALWSVAMSLAGLGYSSIKDSVTKVYDCQEAQNKAFTAYQLENEKRWAAIWRVMDKVCGYQADRMNKEGRVPDYHLEGGK